MEKESLSENLPMGTNSGWQHNWFLDNASSHRIGGDFSVQLVDNCGSTLSGTQAAMSKKWGE